jgi:hypothetical protein
MRVAGRESLAASAILGLMAAMPAAAEPFSFSTGDPDGKMATASRPDSAGAFEIQTADDFALSGATSLTSAAFTGLIPSGSTVKDVVVDIFRVFPNDSDVARTSGPATFSTAQVPTRVNSPSDVAFATRDGAAAELSFSTTVLAASFTALNSVQPGGIHPKPNQATGGDGPATGTEVRFDLTFTTAIALPADHYFFVPEVELDSGAFLWLSAPRPIVPPGTPFPAGITDLQSWTRDAFLGPDWLRVGTDIVGGVSPPTFNAAFSLEGTVTAAAVPEPMSLPLLASGLAGLALVPRRRSRPAGS